MSTEYRRRYVSLSRDQRNQFAAVVGAVRTHLGSTRDALDCVAHVLTVVWCEPDLDVSDIMRQVLERRVRDGLSRCDDIAGCAAAAGCAAGVMRERVAA